MDSVSFLDGRVTLFPGDCLDVLGRLPENSVDAVVCDPPYGLEFMGKEWDGADGFRRSLNSADVGRENQFGRQSSRGPEYRTVGAGQIGEPGIGKRSTKWVSHQGWNQFRCQACGHLFHGGSSCKCDDPKPVRADNRWNLFQAWCEAWASECLRILKPGGYLAAFGGTRTYHRLACGIEDAGFEVRDQLAWTYGSGFNKVGYVRDKEKRIVREGWGGALKPAWEPVCLARKLPVGTVAANMAQYGTGALNIDGCRVGDFVNTTPPGTDRYNRANFEQGYRPSAYGREGEASAERRYTERGSTNFAATPGPRGGAPEGRWPANLIHDGSDEVLAGFPETGASSVRAPSGKDERGAPGFVMRRADTMERGIDDNGGSAARFFYTAKADAEDRIGSKHPTVKPLDLMQYLCRLVTPPGGTILDPFAGTGTTGEAAWREGFKAILVEREAEYQADIARRMDLAVKPTKRAAVAKTKNNLLGAEGTPLFGSISA